LYKGLRDADALPVVLKILNQEYPSEVSLSYFRREFEIARKASGEGTLRIYDLVRYKNTLAIVMEDIAGIPLSQILQSKTLRLPEKLSLAIKITQALSRIHAKKIIHKDINPTNILWNRVEDRVGIIDFGIAAELKREDTHGVLEGTPDYIAPEQTGRINRPVDRRADLYSLGVTLYELFTGQLPFTGNDESEIIYSHIARQPEPPHQLDTNIPEMISNILLKLLAKDAEDRYQMASGLTKDLELCLDNLLLNNDIVPFEIARFDISDQLSIPEKLYGRQDELERLTVLFNDAAEGASSVVMIEGLPGIGKSSLVHEFSKIVALRKGLFIFGRFDKQEQNRPLSALLQALHGLIHWLLSLPESQLQLWRQRILETVPQEAAILTELLPDLEKVIGVQPPVLELNPIEAQNRILIVFSDFIRLFATNESPLVIFMDDLHLCDNTSLALMKYMVGSGRSSHILFIGAYRQNDLPPGHPFLRVLEAIIEKIPTIQTITLQPLELPDVDQMLADTFHRLPDEETLHLSSLVYQKTGGTPYFIHQLLESLLDLGCFTLSHEQNSWKWDLSRIESVKISDNVIDLLSKRIDELTSSAIEMLKIASCIGDQFNLGQLSTLCELPATEVGRILWPVVEKEIISPLDQNYKLLRLVNNDSSLSSISVGFTFQHSRIQQLIYSRIPEAERNAIHLKIGWEYALHVDNLEESEFLFNVVNHTNKGRDLVEEFNERIVLRDLNMIVGTRAMKSTTFSTAAEYFRVAESLLTPGEWGEDPDAWHRTLYNLGEALFLSGELQQAEETCKKMYPLSADSIDRAKVHNLRARIFEFQGRIPETIEEIRQGLNELGTVLPQEDEDIGRGIGQGVTYRHHLIRSDRESGRSTIDDSP
jgi:serine/threonine protein kinase